MLSLEFLVEEPSMEAFLKAILPKILGKKINCKIRNFGSKGSLLKKLEKHLLGYSCTNPEQLRIIILIDLDEDDCFRLKNKLEIAVQNSGLISKSRNRRSYQVLNRIVIQELESWFLGDINAVKSAYPKISKHVTKKLDLSNPDTFSKPSKRIEKLLKRAGYHSGGLAKKKASKEISKYIDPDRNRSHSFQVFREGLEGLVSD